MADIKLVCSYCKGTEFYIQDGLYFCEECDIQCENIIETEYENNFNNETTHRVRFSKSNQKDNLQTRRLTSYEEYNFMLVGMIDEILEIEDIPNFKVTCCRLWMTYLRETESAFFSKTPQIPKLAANYRRADAEILYNIKPRPKYQKKKRERSKSSTFGGDEADERLQQRRRRKQMRKSEKIISQALSESWRSDSISMTSSLANLSIETIISDHEEAVLDIEFSKVAEVSKKNPTKVSLPRTKRLAEDQLYISRIPGRQRFHILTGKTLVNILYCALNICKSNIQLSDLLRFINEGYIKYYKCKAHLPEELIDQNIPLTFERLHSFSILNYATVRGEIGLFECAIPDLQTSIQTPDLTKLAKRYIEDMNLPNQMKDFVQRLIAFHPPKMRSFAKGYRKFNNFEGRAMGYIVFILKLLFGMDDKREKEMSRNSRKINEAIEILELNDKFKPIFVYKDWVNYIEYRKFILEKYYYATMFHDNNSSDKPYTAFNAMLRMLNPDFKPAHIVLSSNKRENTYEKRKKEEKKQSAKGLTMKLISKHKEAEGVTKMDEFSFQSSLTPNKDYFATILENDKNKTINRAIASVQYSEHSFEAYLDPQKLVHEFAEKSLPLKVKVSTFPKPFKFSKVERKIKSSEHEYRPKFLSTETEWLEDLKKQKKSHEIDLKGMKRKFNERQTEKVLKARKFWRRAIMIREKQKASNCSELSRSDLDDIDKNAENDEIKCSDEMLEGILYEIEQEETNELTLVTPDFNLWHNDFALKRLRKDRIEKMEKLPESFQWLLSFASSILHQTPIDVYEEVLLIESQFVTGLQPVELIENMLARKSEYPRAENIKVNKIKNGHGW